MTSPWITAALALWIVPATTLIGSRAADGGQPPLREHVQVSAKPVDRVEISFVVRDRTGRAVTGLGKDDFVLEVDGSETPLEAVDVAMRRLDAPLSIAFLIDVSTSMGKLERKRFLAGAQALLARLRPVDEMMLETFAEEPEVHCDFTSDSVVLSGALETIPAPEGGTNLGRALDVAVEQLSARAGRGVIVLYTDGQAPAGGTSLVADPGPADVAEGTHRRSIALYWIVPHFQGIGAVQRNDGLRNLATTSGGRWILETQGIESALDEVGAELSARYDASFCVDRATHTRRTYEIDLRARGSGATVTAPQAVAGSRTARAGTAARWR